MSSITYRGKLLIIILIATAAYLFYISEQRKASIKKYFTNPEVGDTYKMELDDVEEDGKRFIHFLKIKNITSNGISFKVLNLKNRSMSFSFKLVDESDTCFYSHQQLTDIVEHKKFVQHNSDLIEIIRKKD